MCDQKQPLVSVVMPAWNAARYLRATLETVLSQSYSPVEVVVVDDGSTDETADILRSYGERVTAVVTANSGGPARPRNLGVGRARGEYIAFFDSDDLMEPDKLALEMSVFAEHPEVDVVCSNFRSVDTEGQVLRENYLAEYQKFRLELRPTGTPQVAVMAGKATFSQLLRANFIGTSSMVCRRRVLAAAGPFAEDMKNADDVDMWLRLARGGATFAFVDRALHSYRITPGGVTSRGAGRVPAMIRGLENQLPHCELEADRRFIRRRVGELLRGQAWALRRQGDLVAAVDGYRASLASQWTPQAALGLLRTRFMALGGRHNRDRS